MDTLKEKLTTLISSIQHQKQHELVPAILYSDPEKKKDQDEENLFGKFLKKTSEKKPEHKKKEESSKDNQKDEDSDDDLGDQDKKEEEDKANKKKEVESNSVKQQLSDLFMNGEGGGPDWRSLAYLLLLLGSVGVKIYGSGDSSAYSKEVTYVDFVNEYLAKERIKLITIGSNDSS